MVLMPLECHISVFLIDKSDKSFTVSATLGTQTQSYSTPAKKIK
jgi:hypothetical protein